MLPKRDMLAKVLTEVGITPTIPEGGYFMMADISKLGKFIINPYPAGTENDKSLQPV